MDSRPSKHSVRSVQHSRISKPKPNSTLKHSSVPTKPIPNTQRRPHVQFSHQPSTPEPMAPPTTPAAPHKCDTFGPARECRKCARVLELALFPHRSTNRKTNQDFDDEDDDLTLMRRSIVAANQAAEKAKKECADLKVLLQAAGVNRNQLWNFEMMIFAGENAWNAARMVMERKENETRA